MSDWTDEPLKGPPPGKTQPAPGPQDDGWSQWLKEVAKEAKKEAGGPGDPAGYTVTLSVTRGEQIRFATEGDNPGPWEREPVTSEIQPPDEYKDFTRFRHKYPKITVTEYTRITVTVVIKFPGANGGTWENDYVFWEPGAVVQYKDWWVYRWKQTSGLRERNGKTYKYYDGSVPEGTGPRPWYPQEEFLPSENPPAWAMVQPPKPGDGEYAALVEGHRPAWSPASQETLIVAEALSWARVGDLGKGGKRGRG